MKAMSCSNKNKIVSTTGFLIRHDVEQSAEPSCQNLLGFSANQGYVETLDFFMLQFYVS